MGGARDALGEGELGAAVSENEVPSAIARLLNEPKADPGALSAAARGRFGRETFAAGARRVWSRLMESDESRRGTSAAALR